jgi:hypothetical protein
MNEDGGKKYEFNFLTDEIADADFFEDKTHENVAETLYKLIDANDNGFTIGLEGSWGSGKSTVISILKKKSENKSFHYFYFDAWAHEGDHLRRIFLESLISQLGNESEKFEELEKKISNRKRITTTSTKQCGTTLGKLLAISLLFVPLGAGLVSGVDSLQLYFQWEGAPHWPFWLGVLLSIMPFFVIIGNIIYLLVSKKYNWNEVWKGENWAFLESESKKTMTQEISEEEERSSIEFEKYFREIVSEVLKDNPSGKLMIVIDNLDRIDASDSLKIWSTLQTFLQQRNPSSSNSEWYQNIWIIVPYDMNGLSKLWENETNLCGDDSKGNNYDSCAKSFFDKCFQIRIEVPEPVLTGWESFTKEMINKAFVGWDEKEKSSVLRILKLTRENLGDIPTPREIKNYINQVGILRLHNDEEIPTESIAYYAVHKYLKNTSTKDIKNNLIHNKLPLVEDRPFLPPECNKHLAGVVFGVGAEKGQQLLLEPEIEKFLQDANGKELRNLVEIYGTGFWPVFDHHIDKLTPTSILYNYSKAIYDGLWEAHEAHCRIFIKKLRGSFKGEAPSLPPNGSIEDYLPIIKMSSDKIILEKIWDLVLEYLDSKIENDDEFNYKDNVKYLKNTVDNLEKIPKTHTFSGIDSDKWIRWAKAANSQQIPAYNWILPPQSIEDEIANNIGASSPIIPDTKELLSYSINAGITDFEKIPLACKNHIFQNNGNPINENQPSFEALEILLWLTSCDELCRDEIEELLKTGQFHNFVYHQQKNKSEIYSALLMAHYFKNELHTIQVPPLENSESGVQLMRNVWRKRNEDVAKEIFKNLKKFNQLDLVWDLVENENNKLVADIIGLALEEEVTELFSCSDVLKKMHFIMALIEDEESDMEDQLVDQFMKHSEIEKEIKISSNLDVSTYSTEILLILKKTIDNELIDSIASALSRLEKEDWDTYFAEDTYLADVALEIKNKDPNFSLENDYLDSIFEFAKHWAKNETEVTERQKDQWANLMELMGGSFQKHYKNKITNQLLEERFAVAHDFYEFNHRFFDNQKLYKEGRSKIQDSFEEALKGDGKFDLLEMLDMILKNDKNGDFHPEDHIPDVVSKPLNELYCAQEDMKNKEILKRLSKKFNVEIEEKELEPEKDEMI